MTVRVATVLSAREWEPGLVAMARDSAAIRIVVRAYQPHDIESRVGELDVVVAGGDVSWVSPAHIEAWRAKGLGVIGVVPDGDGPAARLLERGGADEIVPDTIDLAALIQAIRFTAPRPRTAEAPASARVTAVLGCRGAPGVTEVAVSYALARSRATDVLLIDLDLTGPAIAIRLGLPARPDLTDAADAVRAGNSVDGNLVHQYRTLSVVTGSHRLGEAPLKAAQADAVVRGVASDWSEVVLDIGSDSTGVVRAANADASILVVEATPIGIVRAAQLVAEWIGPAPSLVLNKVDVNASAEMAEAVRRWTGLDPTLVIPDRRKVRVAATKAQAPDRRFARAVGSLGWKQ